MTTRYWSPPKPGDIVHCRFSQSAFAIPGPKERPALVTRVEIRQDIVDVEVAYGTSQGIEEVHAGELIVPKSDPDARLDKDTKFDLCKIVLLPFDESWFSPDPAGRFSRHPKRGRLNLLNVQNKKKLQAAVVEAKRAGKLPSRLKRDV